MRNSSAYNFVFFTLSCPLAHQILLAAQDLRRKWAWAVEWLNDELDRVSLLTNVCYINIENHLLLPCLETVMELPSLFLSLSHCMF